MNVKAKDEGAGRRYYTEIPNLVLSLGLTPFELALYVHLKRTAGDGGRCWKSTPTLAKETGMSVGMITKAKEGLTKARDELAGRALIAVTEEPNPHGGKPRHVVTLTDVWPENVARFARTNSHDELASSCGELASSSCEFASSPHEIKKNSGEEEPKKKGVGSRASALSPDALISELAKSPAYAGIDVRREFFKMQAWCDASGKQPSRRRFVNWLNRVDVLPSRASPPLESAATKSKRLEDEIRERRQPRPTS